MRSSPTVPPSSDVSSDRFFNRELSWLKFNARVLEESLNPQTPLLERVKFLSIFASNLDEFFQIRVSGLRRQLQASSVKAPPSGSRSYVTLLAFGP